MEPSKRVPKKYWKYADRFPDRELYAVKSEKWGLIFKCTECGREIPAGEPIKRLYFREPNTLWGRKVGLPLCIECWAKL